MGRATGHGEAGTDTLLRATLRAKPGTAGRLAGAARRLFVGSYFSMLVWAVWGAERWCPSCKWFIGELLVEAEICLLSCD